MISPFYTIPESTCNAEISIKVRSTSAAESYNLDVIIINVNGTEHVTHLFRNRSTQACNTLLDFPDMKKLSGADSMRLVVSAKKGDIEGITEQLSFKTFCPRFDNVYSKSKADHNLLRSTEITYAPISAVKDNSCGMHYWKGKMACDWLKLLTYGEEDIKSFDRVVSNNYTKHGSDDNHFLELQGAVGENRSAILVLPMKTKSARVRVSFWSLIKCKGPRLDLFVVKNIEDLKTPELVATGRERAEEIFQEKSWHFHTYDVGLSDQVATEMQLYLVSVPSHECNLDLFLSIKFNIISVSIACSTC